MENISSLLERFNDWVKESIVVKLASIGFLILILMNTIRVGAKPHLRKAKSRR